uniref:C1q domain-containing protein n=1 Tax=Magallana gigas TaxID=29159 RepID=A0A8W8P283_MAGGI
MKDENNYFEASLKELYAENEQLKGRINNLQDENRTQKKINSQLKLEITHIKKSSLLQTDISKTVVETDGLLTDDYKSVKTIGTNSSTSGIQQNSTSVNNSARTSYKRLLSTDTQPVVTSDHTNIGGHYSHHTGVFTCPSHGVYVFSWSIYCYNGGYVFSELVVNSSPVSGKFVGAGSVTNILSSTDLAIVELNAGDEVYIRTPPNHAASGQVVSDLPYRSTFSGWKLF